MYQVAYTTVSVNGAKEQQSFFLTHSDEFSLVFTGNVMDVIGGFT